MGTRTSTSHCKDVTTSNVGTINNLSNLTTDLDNMTYAIFPWKGSSKPQVVFLGFNHTDIPDEAVIVSYTIRLKHALRGAATTQITSRIASIRKYSGGSVAAEAQTGQTLGDAGKSEKSTSFITSDYSKTYNNAELLNLAATDINKPYNSGSKSGLAWAAEYQNTSILTYDGRIYCVISSIVWHIPATGISVTPDSLLLTKGDTVTLSAAITPSNSTDNISWSSSDSNIASVSGAGIISAKAAGTAVITATTESGVSASCVVTVRETVNVTISSLINASVSPGAGVYIKGDTINFTFTPNNGYILGSVKIGGSVISNFGNPLSYSQSLTLSADIDLSAEVVPATPYVTERHTRERISDKPGYEKSVVTYSSDMAYTEAEIRKTLPGHPKGRGIGELLHAESETVPANAERSHDIYHHHLATDGDYVVSVYVKNLFGVWSG